MSGPETFAALGLGDALADALAASGFERPLPIQTLAVPALLAGGDVVATAETGSGKTLAYVAPLIERATGETPRRSLVLAPTRELASQIAAVASAVGAPLGIETALIHGGVAFGPQKRALAAAALIVATPGRLKDHVERGTADLAAVSAVVLDEADRMLEMGFVEDVRFLLGQTAAERQTALFSATLDGRVRKFVTRSMEEPTELKVGEDDGHALPAGIRHELAEVRVPLKRLLLLHLLEDPALKAVLVFVKSRFRCHALATVLTEAGADAAPLHANLSQTQRGETLEAFREGRLRVLVATDLAERGLDVPHITHVINFDPPNTPEIYVHRVGRTARLFGEGTALNLVASAERKEVEDAAAKLGIELHERREDGFDYDQRPKGLDPLVDRRPPRRRPRSDAPRGPAGAADRPRRKSGWKGDQPREKAEFWERVREKRKRRRRGR